jgi:hypothetical protein
MNLSDLRPNQRYMFRYKNPNSEDEAIFRANFIQLFKHDNWSTLIVNNYQSKKYANEPNSAWWSIDIALISSIECLPNIVGDKFVLPDDILLEIDNYF